MRSLLILLSVSLAGCVASAPQVIVPASPEVATLDVPAEALDVAPEPEIVEIEPTSPPPAPRERIVRRSLFETARVAEWTLSNGMTVVYRWGDRGGAYHARMYAPGGLEALDSSRAALVRPVGRGTWGAFEASIGAASRNAVGEFGQLGDALEAVASVFRELPDEVFLDSGGRSANRAQSEGLASVFDRPEAFTLVIVGALSWEWAESAVARSLAVITGRSVQVGIASRTASVVWTDVPAQWIASEVVQRRGGDAIHGALDAPADLASHVGPVSDAEFREARFDAARRAASPAGRAEALSELYRVDGEFRPARAPSAALDLAAWIERTPKSRVDAYLSQLARPYPSDG